jgi:hypothetical protein
VGRDDLWGLRNVTANLFLHGWIKSRRSRLFALSTEVNEKRGLPRFFVLKRNNHG